MRIAGYLGALLGLALAVALALRADLSAMLHTLDSGGWQLLWLTPYRAVFFLLYALGWLLLIRPSDPAHRAGLGYLLWVTTVREAVDRLLPVASVGGGVIGIRLLMWRGVGAAAAGASVLVEVVLTVSALYLFTAAGLLLLASQSTAGQGYRRLLLAFLVSLPVPVLLMLLLRHGSPITRLQQFLRPLLGGKTLADGAASLDLELRAAFGRWRRLLASAALQFAALASGCAEIWFVLRLVGHPIGWQGAVVLESMTQALRNLAFIVPAGLGVQEAGLVLFGHALGIGTELALAVSMSKRLREVLCGLPALLSWQWQEARRLKARPPP